MQSITPSDLLKYKSNQIICKMRCGVIVYLDSYLSFQLESIPFYCCVRDKLVSSYYVLKSVPKKNRYNNSLLSSEVVSVNLKFHPKISCLILRLLIISNPRSIGCLRHRLEDEIVRSD